MNLEETLSGKAWKTIGIHHHHGINIPLSSIWTKNSCGIGEFLDLIPLIDYCAQLKLDVIQLLPLNDSGLDPSPYNALSSTALHPIYLSLHALPYLCQKLKSELIPLVSLNKMERLPYLRVQEAKLQWLRQYVETVRSIITADPHYQAFLNGEEGLYDYALFKVLKEKNQNQIWKKWPLSEKNLTHTSKRKLYHTFAKELEFHFIVQYLCTLQLTSIKAHAEKKGIFLKGDIPILISPDSVDVWAHQEFFDLSSVAGSPPNSFDLQGQVWGFPLYNWKAMENNHFEWWRKRVQKAAEFFHIYRIDHILGFFRIWSIPHGETADKGTFVPSEPALMEIQGRLLLKTLLSFTNMLPIGEDLGDSSPFIKTCMQELGIPGTKIFRRNRRWEIDRAFVPYADYPPLSISSVSTHDLETVRLWWEKYPDEASDYSAFKKWPPSSKLSYDKQFEILWDTHHSGSLFHVNLLQEYLALIPELTWKDPEKERINSPGTQSIHNWTYRYKKPLEVLLSNEKLKILFEKLLQDV